MDDYEDLFADELEVMREMEDSQPIQGFVQSQKQKPTIGRKSPTPVTRVLSQQRPKGLSQFAKHNPDTPEPSPDKTCTDPKGNSKPVLNGESRKRCLDEMFGGLSSDSEDELVMDIPSPEKISPLSKRPKTLPFQEKTKPTTQLQDGDDFEITPPPSPYKSESTTMKMKPQKDATETSLLNSQLHRPTVLPSVSQSSKVLNRQPDGLSVTVTGPKGKRVYLKMKEEAKHNQEVRDASKLFDRGNTSMGLLQTSMNALLYEVEELRHQKLLKDSQRITELLEKTTARSNNDVPQEDEDATRPEQEKSSNLWVDKYAPRHFTELLSDDGVNRNLLYWLKMWDHVVFGKDKREPRQKQVDKHSKHKMQSHFKKFQPEDQLEEFDDHDRPKLVVALLSGPPGLGKTTLAHVIAEHAGYNAVEMNASDDRSLNVFKTRLENATQMRSVLANDQRPNCLIIDEIDGSPLPTINCLISLLKGTDAGGGARKKKKKKLQLLRRPIICICNDLYVPSLRQLRQIAFVTHFPPTISARLASRLYQISKNNALQTDLTTLMALCSKTDNDIRSCLNTLQFLHGQGKPIKLGTIHSMTIGKKDQHKGLFSTWQDIFQLPRPKRKQYANPHDVAAGRATIPKNDQSVEGNPQSLSARFHKMLHVVQGCGEYEKLVQGIFENYLEVKFKDPHMEGINIACEWLTYFDVLQSEIMHSQNYILNRYVPFTPVVFHMLFATLTRPQIKYPSSSFENLQKETKTKNLIEAMLNDVSPSVGSVSNIRLAVMDLIPMLLIIIQPSFRPINTQLFSVHEKRQLAELTSIMMSYNLTYHQERNVEGQYNYVLDPNLEEVTRFSDTPSSKPMTYAAKQLISREIELEKMRRNEIDIPEPQEPAVKSNPITKTNEGKPYGNPAIPRHKQKLEPKKLETIEDKPAKDFFGRFKKIPSRIREQAESQTEAKKEKPKDALVTGDIWFQFNQGFTNAVRKTVKIQDLL